MRRPPHATLSQMAATLIATPLNSLPCYGRQNLVAPTPRFLSGHFSHLYILNMPMVS